MRIGFSSIYSWRPHVEHLEFLAEMARRAGHETFYLTCDADFPTCYTRELRPDRSEWIHCARCRIGGVRSYTDRNVRSVGSLLADAPISTVDASAWALSSASTLGRFESDVDFASDDFRFLAARLEPTARAGFAAAKRWIEREELDAIFVFNGRMDATRGILEAGRVAGIRSISVERTWFGDGLQLIPDENCLGLKEIGRLVAEWRDRPLNRLQAFRAASHVALRFLGRNSKEWRAYNTGAQVTPWPIVGSTRRILLTPGSQNEVWSHPDWSCEWPDRLAAFDAVIGQLNLRPGDVILRCHPNWGENIGSKSGRLAEEYYTDWAKRRGIYTIASRDLTSTLGLIEHSDAIVVGGGSAALEAAIIGKQVIAVSPSVYCNAGFQSTVESAEQLKALSLVVDESREVRQIIEARTSKQALRFCYTMAYRVAQFVDHVRCQSTTKYRYRFDADPRRLAALINTGRLAADDADFDSNDAAEEEILALIRERLWDQLANLVGASSSAPLQPIRRRWRYRVIDRIRAAFPRGDL